MRDFTKTTLHWSEISAFYYDPEKWYKRYVLHPDTEEKSPEMEFGSLIGKKLETDPTFLPQIPRHNKMEHSWEVKYKKILLSGRADSFCILTNKKLLEYKTGKNAWTQKRVDDHGQLTMYCLLNFLANKVRPEEVEIELHWMPTKNKPDGGIEFVEPIEDNIVSFKTKRTMIDILNFLQYIEKTIVKMEVYCTKRSYPQLTP